MVPLFDIKPQHQAIEVELRAAFERVLRSGQFILGPEVQAFERSIAALLGSRHAIGVSSGTDAILLALMALNIGPGDEVLCPSFTFFATAGCIARTGAKPVFVDCCPVCFNLDVSDLSRRITAKTKAIVPVHLFGQAANLDEIMALAREHDLAVIEDAAQSLGAEYRGRKVGTFGSFGAFSFFPTKNLGGCGDAGMLVTDDDGLAERARLLRTHGAKQKYYHELVGANFRLDALQAALLSVKLPHYNTYTAKRRAHAAYYTERLSRIAGVKLGSLTQSRCGAKASVSSRSSRPDPSAELSEGSVRLILPVAYPNNSPIWNQYTILVPGNDRREALRQFLAERSIGSEVYYPVPLHQQQCFAIPGVLSQTLPTSEAIANQCLSLPIYPELTRKQLDEVVTGIQAFLESTSCAVSARSEPAVLK